MALTMRGRGVAFVFVCLLCGGGHSRRLQATNELKSSHSHKGARAVAAESLEAFALLLALSHPAAGWQAAGHSHSLAARNSQRAAAAPETLPRVTVPRMFFDGVKDFFKDQAAADEISPDDRITPFDRWKFNRGLTPKNSPAYRLIKQVQAEQQGLKDEQYVDPNAANNYFELELKKPMGILFVENGDDLGGVCINEVMSEGSAAETPLETGDQLVGVDGGVVRGLDFDKALKAIQSGAGETAKLTFYRGPAKFLYGPTAPDAAWYGDLLSGKNGELGKLE